MIKIFRGEAGVVTHLKPPPPMNNFCLYPPSVSRCFWKDPLMTPTPTTPLHPSMLPPHPPPLPPKNFIGLTHPHLIQLHQIHPIHQVHWIERPKKYGVKMFLKLTWWM